MKDLARIIGKTVADFHDSGRTLDENTITEFLTSNKELADYIQTMMGEYENWQAVATSTLLTLIRLVGKSGQADLESALEGLRDSLAIDSQFDALKRAASDLKNAVIQMEMSGVTREKKTQTPGNGFDPGLSDSEYVQQIKEVFLSLLNELDQELGSEYKIKLNKLRKTIWETDDRFVLITKGAEIEKIVREYALKTYDDRGRVEAFVAEIAAQLSELEKALTSSFNHIKTSKETNDVFMASLESEVVQTANSMKKITDLSKIQQFVVAKLRKINDLIKEKKKDDTNLSKAFSPEIKNARQRFGDLQDEIQNIQEENRELLKKLEIDPLTGAYNRMFYETYLGNEFERFRRYQRPFSLIVFDVDHFKTINDSYGHVIGDKCLRKIVTGAKAMLRASDSLIRYGGDEFVVVLPETNKNQGAQVAEKIRRTIDDTSFTVKGVRISLTVAVGVSDIEEHDRDYKAVFDKADQALYKAKKEGRNRVVVV